MIRRPALVLSVLLVAGTGAALVHELTRARRPAVTPVTSPLPVHPDELERLEGGFSWTATRAGRPLFTLDGETMFRVEGGVQIFRGVERLDLFLEDGRVVEVEAARGRMMQDGRDDAETVVRLEKDVRIRDPEGMLLETDAVVYDAARREIRSEGATQVSDGVLVATVGSLVYRPDSRLLEGLDRIEIESGGPQPLRIDADEASYRMSTGELVFERPFRARRAGVDLLSGPGLIVLARDDRPAAFETSESVLLTESAGDGVMQLAAAGLSTGQAPASPEFLAGATIGEPASVVLARPGPAGAETVRIGSSNWSVVPEPESGGLTLTAGPRFAIVATSAADRVEVDGEWLEVRRGAAGGIDRVVGREGVVLRGPEATASTGSAFSWERARPGTFVVTGEPARARQRDDVVEAPTLVFDRDARSLRGSGGVLAELSSIERREDAVFSGDEPVRVRSETIEIPQVGGEIVFGGPVQAWQGASSLRAASLRYRRDVELLVAEGSVTLRIDRTENGESRTIGMSGERLDYAGATRVAVLSGRAQYKEPGVDLVAEVMRIHLTDGGDVERLVATGDVRLRTRESRGRADRLTWEGGAQGTVWLIGERDVASLEFVDERQSGVLEVSRIRYELSTGRAHVESGPGRGTLKSRPSAEPGRPADAPVSEEEQP